MRLNEPTAPDVYRWGLPAPRLATISTISEIKNSVYAKLLAKSFQRSIHSESEHARLTGILLETEESDDLSPEEEALGEVLTPLIEDYEEKLHPLPKVSPNESLNAQMEASGLKHKDVWLVLGNKGAAREVLSGRRSIRKAHAKGLAEFFRVQIHLFVGVGR